jgi:hypothetical protein
MEPVASFTQQFFAVSSTAPHTRVLLAGGLYPLSGSRSAYRASVACYDYAAGSVVWLFEQTKSYPFRAITHSGGVCVAILPQNFVNCPTGMFRFDLDSGEPILPHSEVPGVTSEFVDASAETIVFSWVCDGGSAVRAEDERGANVRERVFPYRSMSGGKTIIRSIATGMESFVAVFSLVVGKTIVYSVEAWRLDSESPRWERRTRLKNVVRNDSALMLWECLGPRLDVEILSLESGEVENSFRVALTDVVSVQPIAADVYAILSISGVYVMDAAMKTLSNVLGMGPSEFLDFGALAVDFRLGKLIVVTAGNHKRPGTHLRVLDL